ncbi:hypothetical protein N7516_000231 [Penicillium verrucosum]|uniref:uncharacterized protein n=1 Tax=Penicillium verrucosum TaxID=60171 RepID=UPI00254597B3|nr:uncharacterized protein N7516_000231 [Penicillium verrucosum]KAJ5940063.1 hypothetical protein N7516_000231 [Penicillium verrucosum]
MAGYYRSGKLIAAWYNPWDWLKAIANQQWPVIVPGGSHRAGVYQRSFQEKINLFTGPLSCKFQFLLVKR